MGLNWPRDKGLNPPLEVVKRLIREELGGHSILGSKTVNHFINVEIDPSGQ